jgi:hypothetical protein
MRTSGQSTTAAPRAIAEGVPARRDPLDAPRGPFLRILADPV